MSYTTIETQYRQTFSVSQRLHTEAQAHFPNGVTHDSRHLDPFPLYVQRSAGPRKWDVQGHELIDYWAGHGALLLGHGHPKITAAVQQQMAAMSHPGACHALEVEWAQAVKRLMPSIETLRFLSSGTEAVMMALRLARTFTGQPRILRFMGHFHGWGDSAIQNAAPPYGVAIPGLGPGSLERQVTVLPNDISQVASALREDDTIGCVIIEPTGGHYGHIPVRGPFLHDLRRITEELGRLLIFDEVVTGFRVHPGGAQTQYGVRPDMTVLAKVLAGGLPGAAVGGRREIMALLEIDQGPDHKMPHLGTFNANPVSAAAGIAALDLVATGEPTQIANDMGALLRHQLNEMFARHNVDWVAYGDFSKFDILTQYNGARPDKDDFVPCAGNFERLDASPPPSLQHAFRMALLLNGVDSPPFRGITMATHTSNDVQQTVEAMGEAVGMMRREGMV